MALSTFGAIMGFAAEMVKCSLDMYRAAVEKVEDRVLREELGGLLAEEEKNYSLMEQTRRENVIEMILEPVAGLDQRDYEIDIKVSDETRDMDLFRFALILEEKEQKFFSDSASKVPLPEVARTFRKIAEKKEKRLSRLRSLSLNQLLKDATGVEAAYGNKSS